MAQWCMNYQYLQLYIKHSKHYSVHTVYRAIILMFKHYNKHSMNMLIKRKSLALSEFYLFLGLESQPPLVINCHHALYCSLQLISSARPPSGCLSLYITSAYIQGLWLIGHQSLLANICWKKLICKARSEELNRYTHKTVSLCSLKMPQPTRHTHHQTLLLTSSPLVHSNTDFKCPLGLTSTTYLLGPTNH